MPSSPELTRAHIEAEARLRALTERAVRRAWTGLASYDQADVPNFLSLVVPVIEAAQRQSVALTVAYLARAVDGPAVGLNVPEVIAGLRNGVPSSEVYRRPFVTVWSDLKDHRPYEQAVNAGLARASASAAMDVQLAMRQTLVAVGERSDTIVGYQRVPDADACAFCVLVAGQRYLTEQLLPIHNRCGCGVDVITAADRGNFFAGNMANDLSIPGVAVHEHGELGPVLGDPNHSFLTQDALAA